MGRLTVAAVGAAAVVLVLAAVARDRRDVEIADPGVTRTQKWLKPVGAAVTVDAARDDDVYLAAFLEHFSSLTPENEMKWERLQPRRGRFDFAAADALVELAEGNGIRVRGHPLVWDQQLPAWVRDGRWTPQELEAVLREHVGRVVGRYRGRVAVWDVVNEPFEDDGSWTPSVWHRVLGERYVDIAFEAARAADPAARLVLNEIGAEHEGPKSRALLRLALRLERRGVPIDAVGLQNHTTVTGYPRRDRLAEVMATLAGGGLDAEITEMDVAVGEGDDLAGQALAYAAAAGACAEAANCAGLTVWGVTDRHSWIGAGLRPLLFGADGRAKPAYAAVRSALGR